MQQRYGGTTQENVIEIIYWFEDVPNNPQYVIDTPAHDDFNIIQLHAIVQ